MIVSEEHIGSLLPQKEPFIMVSQLLAASEQQFETDLFIRDTNIFLKNGVLQEAALIENIAQTCAAGFGYLTQTSGQQPRLGFIGSITKLRTYSLPLVNTRILTTVKIMHQLENVYLVKGQNSYLGKQLLECEMKIVIN